MGLGLTFRSLIHSEFILIYGVLRRSSFTFFSHVLFQFYQHCLLHILFIPNLSQISCLFCHRLINLISTSLFLGSLFCSIDLCVFFMPVPCCFDYYSHVVQFDIRQNTSSFFISQYYFDYSESFVDSYKFQVLPQFCEKCHCHFNRDHTEFTASSRQYGHFDDANSSNPWTWYILPFTCIFFNVFSSMSYNFPSSGLFSLWLNLLLGILFFLRQL